MSNNQKQAEDLKNKGNQALQKNNLDQALQFYSQSINLDPKLSASYCNRALIYLKKCQFQLALEDCNKAISIDQNYVRAYQRRGKAYEGLGKLEESLQDFKKVIHYQPDNSDAKHDLKNIQDLIEQQKKQNKINLKAMDSMNLEEIQNHKARVATLINEGKFPEAQQDITELLRLLKDQDQATKLSLWSNLTLCYMQLDEPSRVVEQANLIIDHPSTDDQLLAKTYLRRALAFEKLDKNKKAVEDFLKVKELQPGNLQAAQGLNRLKEFIPEKPIINEPKQQKDQELKKERVQTTEQTEQKIEQQVINETKDIIIQSKQEIDNQNSHINTTNNIEQDNQNTEFEFQFYDVKNLEQIKLDGNQLFKNQKIEEALTKFQLVANNILKSKILNSKDHQDYAEIIKLYTQVQTNSAICYNSLKQHQQVLDVSEKVLEIDPANLKALYRRGVALFELAQQIQDVLQKKAMLEKSRKDLERVCYLDPTNTQSKQLLDQVTKLSVQVRIQAKPFESINQEQKEKQEEKKVETKQKEQKKITSNLSREQLQQITCNIQEKVIQELLLNFTSKVNHSQLCKNVTSFKQHYLELIVYLDKFQTEEFVSIFKTSDFPIEIHMKMVEAVMKIDENAIESSVIDRVFNNMRQCNKFDFCMKCLSKNEKNQLKEKLTRLGSNAEWIKI